MFKRYEIIDHTADIGIKATGASLSELFVNAAEGMAFLIVRAESRTVSRLRSKNIYLVAIDKEQLLVKWLQEILYLFETKKLVPVKFGILELSDEKLKANVSVVPFDPKVHHIKYQIKAVTHHNIAIKKARGQFEATVIFDV